MELLDREKPQVIVNFAAQGEGATSLEALVALLRDQLRGARQARRGAAVARLSRALHPDRHARSCTVRSSMRPQEDEPISRRAPTRPRRRPSTCIPMSVHRFLKFPMNIIRPSNAYWARAAAASRDSKGGLCGLTGRKLPLHGGGARRSPTSTIAISPARSTLVAEKAPLGSRLQCRVRRSRPRSARVVELVRGALEHAVRAALRGDRRPPAPGSRAIGSTARPIKRDVGWEPQISLAGRHARDGRMGRKYLPQLKTLPDRLRHAGLMLRRGAERVQPFRRVSRFCDHGCGPPMRWQRCCNSSDGRYLMQLRDSNPDIFYPEHWGCSRCSRCRRGAGGRAWCGNSRRSLR